MSYVLHSHIFFLPLAVTQLFFQFYMYRIIIHLVSISFGLVRRTDMRYYQDYKLFLSGGHFSSSTFSFPFVLKQFCALFCFQYSNKRATFFDKWFISNSINSGFPSRPSVIGVVGWWDFSCTYVSLVLL